MLSFREIAAHVSWRLPGCHLMLVHKTRVDWRGLKSSAYLILSKEYYFQFCDSQTSTNCYYHQRVNNSSDRAAQMTTRQQAACMVFTSIYLPPLSPMPWSHTMVAWCLPLGLTTYVRPYSTRRPPRPPAPIHPWRARPA